MYCLYLDLYLQKTISNFLTSPSINCRLGSKLGRMDVWRRVLTFRAFIVKLLRLQSPYSIMSSLKHVVLHWKFIITKSFMCPTPETSSSNTWPIVAIVFLRKVLHSHRTYFVVSFFSTSSKFSSEIREIWAFLSETSKYRFFFFGVVLEIYQLTTSTAVVEMCFLHSPQPQNAFLFLNRLVVLFLLYKNCSYLVCLSILITQVL